MPKKVKSISKLSKLVQSALSRQSNNQPTLNMKFFAAIFLLAALVAVSNAEEPASRKLDPVSEAESSEPAAAGRDKRGFVLGAYSAPLTAAVPAYTAAYTAPVAAAYTGLPYAYSAYNAYSPYYSYPAYYV